MREKFAITCQSRNNSLTEAFLMYNLECGGDARVTNLYVGRLPPLLCFELLRAGHHPVRERSDLLEICHCFMDYEYNARVGLSHLLLFLRRCVSGGVYYTITLATVFLGCTMIHVHR